MTFEDNAGSTDLEEPTDEVSGETEVAEIAAESAELGVATDVDDATAKQRGGAVRRASRAVRSQFGWKSLVATLATSAGLATWMFFCHYQPSEECGPAATKTAQEAAVTGTSVLLSYSAETVEKDFAAAKTHLTGAFLDYYARYTNEVVIPAAKQKALKTKASVVRSAVADMHPDAATVLVFVNQMTTSSENTDGAFAANAVRVGLEKIHDTWLISSFDPV